MALGHGMGEQGGTKFSGHRCPNPVLEKEPGMAAISGLGPFHGDGDVKPGAGIPDH